MPVPYRTGIPTILTIGRKMCKLLVVFRPVVSSFLTAPQLALWDALLVACQNFEDAISHPHLGD